MLRSDGILRWKNGVARILHYKSTALPLGLEARLEESNDVVVDDDVKLKIPYDVPHSYFILCFFIFCYDDLTANLDATNIYTNDKGTKCDK